MSADSPITFSFAGLSAGYCFTTPERFALDIVAAMSGYIPGQYSVIIDSDTEPAAADRGKLWHKRIGSSSGVPTGRIYGYYGGAWVSQHPIGASDPNYRRWFEGDAAAIATFDGGDNDPPSDNSGPMWEVDTNYDFRFPLAAGTSPKPTTVVVGDTGGEEEHVLVSNEVAKHQHLCWPADGGDGNTDRKWSHQDPGGESDTSALEKSIIPNDNGSTTTTLIAQYQSDGDAAHNNMPPYRVGYWLKRTSRVFYKA